MTKHAIVTIKVPLHDDELERGPQLELVKSIKANAAEVGKEHGVEISHAIVGDEPPTPAKVRKPRALKPVTEVVPEPTPEPETVHRGRRVAAA
jgi:hypothetical protein